MVVNISKDKLTHFKFPESLLQVLFTFRRTWQWFLPAIALLLFPPYSLFPVSLPRRIYAVGTRWGSEINQCPWQIYATKNYKNVPDIYMAKAKNNPLVSQTSIGGSNRWFLPNLTSSVEQIFQILLCQMSRDSQALFTPVIKGLVHF